METLDDLSQTFPQLHRSGLTLHLAVGHLHGTSADMRRRVPGTPPSSRPSTREGTGSEGQRASPIVTSWGPRAAPTSQR